MRRYRLAACAVAAVLPFTALAACQSGNSSAGGAPAPVPSVSGTSSGSEPAKPSVPSGPSGSDSGSKGFCQQFSKTHQDLILDRGKDVDLNAVQAEVQQTIGAAPDEIKQPVTTILNAYYAIVAKDPNMAQLGADPAMAKAASDYKSWADSNC